MMNLYIQGIGLISPQGTFGSSTRWDDVLTMKGSRFTCIEPDYTSLLDVRVLRRMSRVIKMGIASALQALKDGGIDMPQGIITGTAYGCLEDTGSFLSKMIENNEQLLNPTPFIQSTHNSIGSQVALFLKCHGYNQTISHRAFSFEHAVLDAFMLLKENEHFTVLVGAVDEITDYSFSILSRFGLFRSGINAGEGAAFFTISNEATSTTYACIRDVRTFYKPDSVHVIEKQVTDFLASNRVSPDEVDLILNGSSATENFPLSKYFKTSLIIPFKDLCGEYPTASSFACGIGAYLIKNQTIPGSILSKYKGEQRPIERVLIYNPYFGTHYGMILLERVKI